MWHLVVRKCVTMPSSSRFVPECAERRSFNLSSAVTCWRDRIGSGFEDDSCLVGTSFVHPA
jgi:hypothetical protein